MKRIIFSKVIFPVILICLMISQGFSIDAQEMNSGKETIKLKETINLIGTALNVAVNKTALATVTISLIGTNISAEGFFDEINLFGTYKNLKGFIVRENADTGTKTLQFEGIMNLGDHDNSGFPPKTQTQFVLSLILSSGGALGTYKVGKLNPYFDYEQYGIMNLSIQKQTREIE